jgi:pyruvate ferredoxin oxidoreductase gamma subunit
VLTLPSDATPRAPHHLLGATCAAAAARIVGVVSLPTLEGALAHELAALDTAARDESLAHARSVWEAMAAHAGSVIQTPEPGIDTLPPPEWVDVPFDPARVSAPNVHGAATSVQVKTGLWRTMRPVIDLARCHRCTWVCGSLCPDGAIHVDGAGAPQIDYDHCKGCLVCVAVCPPHAIDTLPEREAVRRETGMVTA